MQLFSHSVQLFCQVDNTISSRAKQKEAQYEALLVAGRKQWCVGEHVRFYRASNSTPVWLPDDVDDISPLEEHFA